MGMVFESREDAGGRLGEFLKRQGVQADVVLGLPRGGVVVAAEVARILKAPLGVLVVRKIGHPLHREFAVGALAEGGVVLLDESVVGHDPIVRAELENVIKEEQTRLREYQARFHQAGPTSLTGKRAMIVDDGLATGATAEAGAVSVRQRLASRVILAAPVASTHAIERLRRVADEVLVMWADADFDAVGRYYAQFAQTTDEEVLGLLKAA